MVSRRPTTRRLYKQYKQWGRRYSNEKKNPKSLNPLELEEFYKEINFRERFFHESIEKEPLLELERNLVKNGRRSNSVKKTRDIFLEMASKEPKQDLESGYEEYNNNRRSECLKRADKKIKQIRELLATKSKRSFGKLIAEQASLIRAASYYWLDEGDGKLY